MYFARCLYSSSSFSIKFWQLRINGKIKNSTDTVYNVSHFQTTHIKTYQPISDQSSYLINHEYTKKLKKVNLKNFLLLLSQFLCKLIMLSLTHFQPMFHFDTPWKHLKTWSFLMVSGGIELEHWLKMGYSHLLSILF